jgi:hypothetical protein
MSVEIINKLNSPKLAMMVELGILDALASRGGEDWWVGVFEFDARQAFQVVIVGPGLAWNETFPKEDAVQMREFVSYAAKSAIEALRFLRADYSGFAKAS